MNDLSVDDILTLRQQTAEDIVDVNEPDIQLVVFTLADQPFAFHGRAIKEILAGDEPIYPVPGMPDSVTGVINLRGDIESVIFLHALLQLPTPRNDSPGGLLLGQSSRMRSAIHVDQLLDVMEIPESSLHQPPASLPESLRPYTSALFEFRGQPVTVLDLELVFAAYLQGLE